MKRLIPLTLISAVSSLALTSCGTTYNPSVELYDKEGKLLLKVYEKNLAEVSEDGKVPLVRLRKGNWQQLADGLIDTSIVVGKGVVLSYADELLQRRVTVSK